MNRITAVNSQAEERIRFHNAKNIDKAAGVGGRLRVSEVWGLEVRHT